MDVNRHATWSERNETLGAAEVDSDDLDSNCTDAEEYDDDVSSVSSFDSTGSCAMDAVRRQYRRNEEYTRARCLFKQGPLRDFVDDHAGECCVVEGLQLEQRCVLEIRKLDGLYGNGDDFTKACVAWCTVVRTMIIRSVHTAGWSGSYPAFWFVPFFKCKNDMKILL